MARNTATRGERIRTASRHRREQEKEELRQTILKAAGALFLEQGYDGFSMRHLAESIGYSPATLYLYFRDKDDLLCIHRESEREPDAPPSTDSISGGLDQVAADSLIEICLAKHLMIGP